LKKIKYSENIAPTSPNITSVQEVVSRKAEFYVICAKKGKELVPF
jgi:hypothetical protein